MRGSTTSQVLLVRPRSGIPRWYRSSRWLKTGGPPTFKSKTFCPWFYVDLNEFFTFAQFKSVVAEQYWARNVVSCELVARKRFIGFADGKSFDYVLMTFTGLIPMYCSRKYLRTLKVHLHEDSVDPLLKFFHSSGIKPSSYFEMDGFVVWNGQGKTHCSREYYVAVQNLRPSADSGSPPPIPMCSYDIESSGLDPASDYVFQVSLCFGFLGEDLDSRSAISDSFVICVGDVESVEGTPILCVQNELQLLKKFREIVVERQVCILVGYNSYQFDGQFLYKRAVDTYNYQDFCKIGFLRNDKASLKTKVLESSALGKNELSQFVIPGRVEFDALMTVRRNHKLGSYKLDSVCRHFFGGKKDDVSYEYILSACESKDPKKLGVIAKYCLQDAWLTLRLVSSLKDVYNGLEMSKLCVVPLSYIESRGQQIKCLSLILDRVHGEFVCNKASRVLPGGVKFQGATVIDATKGFHNKDPVVCLDFASLYPSIIRWKNLCYTTYLDSDEFANIPGVHYERFEISPGVYETFATRPGHKGILSAIEEDLGEARRQTKAAMKVEKDSKKLQLLNSKQLAQKVTMNSLYGFCGTVNGCLPLVAIAAAVTCTGRSMIKTTADFIRTEMGGTVIYGDTDSVMCTFPAPQTVRGQGKRALLGHAYAMGLSAEEKSLSLFGHPVKLEYEKIYFPFLLISKKRYACMSYDRPDSEPKMSTSGLVTVRRDNAKVVRDCANGVISILMEGRGQGDVVEYVKTVLSKLENSEIGVEDLTISNELKKHPDQYATPSAHSVLAGKLNARAKNQKLYREIVRPVVEQGGVPSLGTAYGVLEGVRRKFSFDQRRDVSYEEFLRDLANGRVAEKLKGSAPQVSECESLVGSTEDKLIQEGIRTEKILNDMYREFSVFDRMYWEAQSLGSRVPYVIVRGNGSVNERSEDPRFVEMADHLRIDTKYYIDQQLKNPILGIVEAFPDGRASLERVFREFSRRADNANKGRREITSFFERSVRSKV
uniref:DNA polymerase n=1 Tax=Feldmannia species virus TaxID=39420 RepID=O36638_9PHYC|nr:DNA-dependent DNA polymerase homolog [Feldmannia species virus]